MAIESIRNYFVDSAVIGIDGVDPVMGFSDQNIEEAAIARAMIARSNESIVLADASKFNRQGIGHVADFDRIDNLVSNQKPSDDICKKLKNMALNCTFQDRTDCLGTF
ncbi:MAG: hypothetical protein V3U76_18705 [Granulosicoccus sp.]